MWIGIFLKDKRKEETEGINKWQYRKLVRTFLINSSCPSSRNHGHLRDVKDLDSGHLNIEKNV